MKFTLQYIKKKKPTFFTHAAIISDDMTVAFTPVLRSVEKNLS